MLIIQIINAYRIIIEKILPNTNIYSQITQ